MEMPIIHSHNEDNVEIEKEGYFTWLVNIINTDEKEVF
jgi:hypothetical protein